jgi:hypothetical protein
MAKLYPLVGALVALGAAWLAACGGRLGDDKGVTGSGGQGGGASGAAGQSGGSSGGQGGGSAGAAGAGMAGQGGSSSCENTTCAGCAPGFVSVPVPGACCPACQPVPCNGACAVPACPSDGHLETPPGQCCPICVSPSDCERGRNAYSEFRTLLIEKYNSVGCKTDEDCTLVYESNRCTSNCGTVFPVQLAKDAAQNLQSSADSNCASCPPPLPLPCPRLLATCLNGTCTMGGPAPVGSSGHP